MLAAVKQQGLEGVVAKRRNSVYEAGERTGVWVKHRMNRGQEFVIGGYTPGTHGIDAIVIGYYKGNDLIYAARTRNGFVPAARRSAFQRLKSLRIAACPFILHHLTGDAESEMGGSHDGRKDEGVFGFDLK